MGKKNKYKDMWDLSPEEQQAGLEEFAAFEKGMGDISSISNRDDSSGLTVELASLIASDVLSGKTKSKDTNRLEPVKEVETESVSLKAVVHKEETVIKQTNEPICNTCAVLTKRSGIIRIIHKKLAQLNRLILSDGIAPNGVSLSVSSTLAMENFNIDDCTEKYEYDNFEDFITDFVVYTITLKHPTAVYTYEEFYSHKYLFDRCLNEWNRKRFIFVALEEYVLGYEIDYLSFEEFFNGIYNTFADEKQAKTFTTRHAIALALSAGSLNQAFFIEDNDYIESLHKSDLNMKDEFSKNFINDPETVLTDDPENENTGIDMYDAESLQSDVRGMISIITGDDYFGDDDDEDDEDEDDDDDYDDIDILPRQKVESTKSVDVKVSVVEAEKNLSDVVNMVNEGVNELLNDTPDDSGADDLLNDSMQIVETQETTVETTVSTKVDRVSNNSGDDDWTVPVIGKGK